MKQILVQFEEWYREVHQLIFAGDEIQMDTYLTVEDFPEPLGPVMSKLLPAWMRNWSSRAKSCPLGEMMSTWTWTDKIRDFADTFSGMW